MIVFIQLLLKYILFQKFNLTTSLDDFHFSILIFSTVLIALAGYIINDINDVQVDIINKPNKVFVGEKISEKKADILFLVFNFIGLLLGYYLSYSIDEISFFAIYIIASLLSYLYSIKLKNKVLFKNLIVSFLVFLSVFIVGLYDIVPATSAYNNEDQLLVFNLVMKISFFAFLLTFLREIVKDIEDIEGDGKLKMKTFPIVIGIRKTKVLLVTIGVIIIITITYFSISLFSFHPFATYYLIALVSIPLLYFVIKINYSNTKKSYKKLSNLLKIIMLLGILIVFLL
ncbi:MAG: geranylgeranylglycerol-phosphate geranylgeranyltransferase [Flavobacteriaceae bacterium]|nr:geranylgeranylglycerol-phosphate geranylgeranyltransferase [Flavobacteriaceae bacterium]